MRQLSITAYSLITLPCSSSSAWSPGPLDKYVIIVSVRAQKGKHIQMYAHNLSSITNRAPTKDVFNDDNNGNGDEDVDDDDEARHRTKKKTENMVCIIKTSHI